MPPFTRWMDGCFFWFDCNAFGEDTDRKILDESLLHTTIALKVYCGRVSWQWKQWPSAKEGLKKSALRSGIELALIQQKTSKNNWNVVYPSNIRGTFNLEMTWNSLLRYVKTWRSTVQNIWQQLLHITPNQRDQIDISPNKMPINLLQNASNFIFFK